MHAKREEVIFKTRKACKKPGLNGDGQEAKDKSLKLKAKK